MSKKQIENEVRRMIEASNPYAGYVGIVYARVSSKRQELEGHGRESQEGRCKADLNSIDVPYDRSFIDTYTGGGDFMNRPAMREMLAYIDANPHKKFVVIFDDLKRFARDTAFHLKLRSALKARDVLPRCLNYNFDDSPEGMFVETVLAAGNELERHQNRRQVIQKMKARLEAGYWPFAGKRGYDIIKDPIHGKLLKPNQDGLTLLKKALEDFASGALRRKVDVARFLFERGFWKRAKRSPESYIDEVTVMLQDVAHCGDIEYPKWGVARRRGHHQAIITQDTFARIQQRLKKEETKSRIRVDINPDLPLRGLVLCDHCKTKLTAAPCKGRKDKYFLYYCRNKNCPLYSKSFRKADVERDFRTLLQRNRLKSDVGEIIQLTFDRVWKQEVADLKHQETLKERHRTELEAKIRDLTELTRTARSDLLKKTYEAQTEDAARELEQAGEGLKRDLGVPYRTAMTKATGMLKNPVSIWDVVDVVEKHRLFFFLFEAHLAYTKTEGYRTGNELSSTRLFEEFCDENSDDVDLGGIEPPPPQCECGVLPLNYRPSFGTKEIYQMLTQCSIDVPHPDVEDRCEGRPREIGGEH